MTKLKETDIHVSQYMAIQLQCTDGTLLKRLLTLTALFFQPGIAIYNWLKYDRIPLGVKVREVLIAPFRVVRWIVCGGSEPCCILLWKEDAREQYD